ncbi:MAG TPA: methyltransferase domain-containing protein [Acidobacteriaceae bacterium]|nr:methyltransferase domain-containing protein [Acidobacteriaceae bacterium]
MTTMTKAYKGMGMEGGIARWYDKTTRKDMPAVRELAAKIAGMAPAGGSVLEVAPGPGFLSIELAKRGLDVQAVDISKTFLEIARKNAAAEGAGVVFMHGNAVELPVRKESVDFVVCRAAFKNFTEPVKAMREMLRVLKPGGTALLIDMRRDVSVAELRKYVDGLGVSWLNRKFMMLTFRGMLIKRAYPLEQIRQMAAEAGWKDVRMETTPVGFAAWVKK